MTSDLTGSSREALRFMQEHWVSLVRMSSIPVVLFVVTSGLELLSIGSALESVMSDAPPAQVFRSIALSVGIYMLSGTLLVASCLLWGWSFATIIRFRAGKGDPWLMLDADGSRAAAFTVLYGLAVLGLSIAVLLIILAAVGLPIGLIALGYFGIDNRGALLLVASIVFAAALFSTLWLTLRFAVVLPAVAVGRDVDLADDGWPMTRGVSWAMPWRFTLALTLFLVAVLLLFRVLFGDVFHMLLLSLGDGAGIETSYATFSALRYLAFKLAALAMAVPLFWFLTLSLAIAYDRLRNRSNIMEY